MMNEDEINELFGMPAAPPKPVVPPGELVENLRSQYSVFANYLNAVLPAEGDNLEIRTLAFEGLQASLLHATEFVLPASDVVPPGADIEPPASEV